MDTRELHCDDRLAALDEAISTLIKYLDRREVLSVQEVAAIRVMLAGAKPNPVSGIG